MTISLAPKTVFDTSKGAQSVAPSKDYIKPHNQVKIKLYKSWTVIFVVFILTSFRFRDHKVKMPFYYYSVSPQIIFASPMVSIIPKVNTVLHLLFYIKMKKGRGKSVS